MDLLVEGNAAWGNGTCLPVDCRVPTGQPNPVNELGHAVCLVVMTRIGEGQAFAHEVFKPWCFNRDCKLATFDLGGGNLETLELVHLRNVGTDF